MGLISRVSSRTYRFKIMKYLSIFTGLPLAFSMQGGFGESDTDYTIKVHAGKRDCYFEDIKAGSSFELEYQVIDGGDLDITFQMIDPKGKILATDIRKEDGLHTVDEPIDGAYQFCFDNGFSRLTDKVVFFEIFTDDFDYDYDGEEWKPKKDEGMLEDRVKEIQSKLQRMKLNMAKTSQIQNLLRAFEAKDRNLIEANRQRVDSWSIIHLTVMAGTAFLQVYLLRSMFNVNAGGTKGMRA